MQRSGITAAGTWTVDYTKVVSQFPCEGTCTSVLDETVDNGGAPYNLLVDLCRLGASFPLRAVGRVGHDLDGASILKDCRAHHLDTSGLQVTPEASTSFSDVMVNHETGVRTSFNHAGANALFTADDVDFRHDRSRIFYLGTLFFLKALDAPDSRHGTCAAGLLAAARKQGLKTCIDIERANLSPALFERDGRAALRQTDLAILNVEVAEMLLGARIRYPAGIDIAAAESAARALQKQGSAECVIIRFPTGALGIREDGSAMIEGSVKMPKSRVISAAGAGHAFTAGVLYGCHEGWSLSECLRAGHAAAAACLTDRTASGGLKSLDGCLKLVERYGQRELGGAPASQSFTPAGV